MVISGTHALDIVMWLMEAKKPVELYARSVDKALGPQYKGIDATAGVVTFEDGSLYRGDLVGAADHLAGRGLQPRGRDQRHRRGADHRRHASGHCFGNNEKSI